MHRTDEVEIASTARRRRLLLTALAMGALACQRTEPPPASSTLARAANPGPQVTMMALHSSGGVPPGWRFMLPPGSIERGRATFGDLGCSSCHAIGPNHPAGDGVGPDLAGMGSHHPPGYFTESILNPDAVLVSGQGYLGPDGRSIMPSYPDLTAAQLTDLVAYLQSLRTGEAPMPTPPAPAALDDASVPLPPAQRATAFYAQRYTIQQGRRAELEEWFKTTGAQRLLALNGMVSIESYVDAWSPSPSLVTVFGFPSPELRDAFTQNPALDAIGAEFDQFLDPHDHRPFGRPPIYPAPSLSAP